MPIAFHYAARSDVGLVRSNNQDSAYAGPHLLVVADGMGGHAGGDLASAMAISRLTRLDGESHRRESITTQLVRAVADANADIGQRITERPELRGMGTTVTAILRSNNTVALAHIGDSRAYQLQGDAFSQITHDHSFVQTLVDEGRISEDEASTHPQRSLVTRVLTGEDQDEPDVSIRETRIGDRFLLCSDGLSGFVARDTIEEVLRSDRGPGATADTLIDLALKAGAPDNVTVIVCDVVDVTAATSPPTQPQIVGSAALHQNRRRTTSNSSTPAAKAAALRPSAEPAGLELAEEGSTRFTHALKIVGGVLAVVLVLGAGLWGGWRWTQSQYYLGARDGHVAIYRGLSQDIGPINLSEPVSVSDIALTDLPTFDRDGVTNTIPVESLDAAQQRLTELEATAKRCRAAAKRGNPCSEVPA